MTEINSFKFYQFLTNFNKNGETWIDVADGQYGNNDGTVIKSEFRSFINTEWNGAEDGTLTNDIINKFWKSLDTNTSTSYIEGTNKIRNNNALDSNEIENLDLILKNYEILNEVIADKVKIPSVLTTNSAQTQWKNSVVNALQEELKKFLQNNGNTEELKTILEKAYDGIANKNTAEYCAIEYQEELRKGILKDYPDYKIADDKTLDNIISNYLKRIDPNATPETIKTDIRGIVDAYLATAFPDEINSDKNLSDYGYTQGNTLNDLQVAVVSKKIKDEVGTDTYKGLEKELDAAIKEFINDTISSLNANGNVYDELLDKVSDFKNSPAAKKLNLLVAVDKNYSTVSTDSSFYQKLVNELGETIANEIVNNGRYGGNYEALITDVKAKVQSGELKSEADIETYMVNSILASLDKFAPKDLSLLSNAELETVYNKLSTAADLEPDNDLSAQKHKDAAIKYCNAIAKKGEEYQKAIKDAFGTSDYKTAINDMLAGTVKATMKKLIEAVNKILDINEMDETKLANLENELFKNVPDPKTEYSLGAEASFMISLPTTIDNKTITTDRYTFEASGCLKVSDIGKVTIDTSKTGTYSGEVSVYLDGVKIGTKTVTITVNADLDWKKCYNTNINGDWITFESDDSKRFADVKEIRNLSSLYSNGTDLILYEGDVNYQTCKSGTKSTLHTIIDAIATGAEKLGGNKEAIEIAKRKTKAIYDKALDSYSLASWKTTQQATVTDEDGNKHTYTKTNYLYRKTAYGPKGDNTLGLAINRAKSGCEGHQVTINMRNLMDIFEGYYKAALGITT